MKRLLQNSSIGMKVSLAPAFAIACLIVVALVGWLANRSLTADVKTIGGERIDHVVDAQAFATQLTELHQKVYQSLTWEAIGQRPEMIKGFDEQLSNQITAFGKTVNDASADASLAPAQRDAMLAFAKGYQTYAKFAKDTLDIKTSGVAMAASFVPTVDGEYKASAARIAQFVAAERAATRTSVAAAEDAANRNGWVIAGVLVIAVVMSAALALFFSRAIAAPLRRAADIAGSLAHGDLRYTTGDTTTDATGKVLHALQDVSSSLGRIVAEVRSSANQINTASSEIASGTADLSSRTEDAASSLELTASSVSQLSASIKASADSAVEVNRLAQQATVVAREGGSAIGEVVDTMSGISVQAKKIGEIVAVIDGIAFQTNILALNAAVEAARAGEQGRGFAVVAQEVRTLASRSGAAAREIRELIARSVESAEAGTTKVQVAGATMERIVDSIQRVSGMVEGISRATVEQATGIEQVNKAVGDMDRATQQNAAMVEEATAATDSLRTQAQGLVSLLTRFQTA